MTKKRNWEVKKKNIRHWSWSSFSGSSRYFHKWRVCFVHTCYGCVPSYSLHFSSCSALFEQKIDWFRCFECTGWPKPQNDWFSLALTLFFSVCLHFPHERIIRILCMVTGFFVFMLASQPAIHSYGYYGQRSGPFGNWEPKRSTCTHTKTRSPKHHRMINMVSGYVRLQSHLTPNDGASCACATGRIEQRHVDC